MTKAMAVSMGIESDITTQHVHLGRTQYPVHYCAVCICSMTDGCIYGQEPHFEFQLSPFCCKWA